MHLRTGYNRPILFAIKLAIGLLLQKKITQSQTLLIKIVGCKLITHYSNLGDPRQRPDALLDFPATFNKCILMCLRS